jgi:extracellular factor (EF) 3-hydroxypalmitic acid methyl ester biosynthesis protein
MNALRKLPPPPVLTLVHAVLDATCPADIGAAVREFFDEVDTLSDAEQAELRADFRHAMSQSWLLNHAIAKPYGYPGDFEILETIYEGQTPSTEQGRLIDDWCLSTSLPKAVKERKDIIRQILQASSDGINVLSLASGSARELREMGDVGTRTFTLVDTDAAPLEFFKSHAPKGDVRCIVGNAMKCDVGVGEYDLVYSFGLYDYLPERVLDRTIRNALRHMKDDGEFVFSLKDSRFYLSRLYSWFCDWNFIPRTIEDLEPLLQKHHLKLKKITKTQNEAAFVVQCSR